MQFQIIKISTILITSSTLCVCNSASAAAAAGCRPGPVCLRLEEPLIGDCFDSIGRLFSFGVKLQSIVVAIAVVAVPLRQQLLHRQRQKPVEFTITATTTTITITTTGSSRVSASMHLLARRICNWSVAQSERRLPPPNYLPPPSWPTCLSISPYLSLSLPRFYCLCAVC